jgi:mRNA interferase MazF
MAIFCPITSKIKNYPFEVRITNKEIDGVVLSDQIKSLDWKNIKIEFIIKEDIKTIKDIIKKLSVLIDE